jgi:hypothetical protein
MAHYLAPLSNGIGDLIVSLPVVQGLIDSGYETYLITRSNMQEELVDRIEGLSGSVSEEAFSAKNLSKTDVYLNLREHPLQKSVWWGSPECDRAYPGWKINDFLGVICNDFGIKANFKSLKPLRFKRQEEFANSIVFIPGSDGIFKHWPADRWLSLAKCFEAEGFSVLMLGQPACSSAVKELMPFLGWLPTSSLSDALDVVSSARGLVGLDTGLTHLAVHQGIPTICIYRSHPVYIRDYPNSFSVIARACDARCVTVSLDHTCHTLVNLSGYEYRSWICQSPNEESCMFNIAHDKVFDVAQSNPDLFLRKPAEMKKQNR